MQALEDGDQVQDLDYHNHLDQGKLLLADVVVAGGALVLLGVLGALLGLVVLDGEQVQAIQGDKHVQALQDSQQVQALQDCDHLDQGKLLLAAVVVPGGRGPEK